MSISTSRQEDCSGKQSLGLLTVQVTNFFVRFQIGREGQGHKYVTLHIDCTWHVTLALNSTPMLCQGTMHLKIQLFMYSEGVEAIDT